MPRPSRFRRSAVVALTAATAIALPLLLTACHLSDPRVYPSTTFAPHTEFGRYIDDLWNLLLRLGVGVFIFVEGLLVITLIRFRARPGGAQPKHVHGNTTLEVLWTIIPAVILITIAVPTVRTIFLTEAKASPDALQVEVIGHQWWWEFRYPQYNVITADELYLPAGRKVNFSLRTNDVLHSFWVPAMGGKRDLISNHTNYLWYTPADSMAGTAWDGSCNEYCGEEHADMRFRAFVLSQADFERWAAHEATPAIYNATPAPPPAPAPAARTSQNTPRGGLVRPVSTGAPQAAAPAAPQLSAAAQDTTAVFPRDHIPTYVLPTTPIPEGLTFTPNLVGDAARGQKVFSSGLCIGCHTVKGNPMAMGPIGPNLTHVGSRYTIAGSLYPNDTEHLRLWIKNARLMKPGVTMPTLGIGEIDPITHAKVTPATGGLTDQQIADIAAYLQALK